MKIHQGDTVLVISGKDKGKTGTVLRILKAKNRVIVAGVNIRTKHTRKTSAAPGQRMKYEVGLSVSNVMIVDPKTGKPTRIGYKIDEKGKKSRIAKASGTVIEKATAKPKASTAKDQKAEGTTAAKKSGANASNKVGAGKPDQETATGSAPKKGPFWKKLGFGADELGEPDNHPTAAVDNAPAAQTIHSRSGSRGS